jgi:hypothetical protein
VSHTLLATLVQQHLHLMLLAGLACTGCSNGTTGAQLGQLGSSLTSWWDAFCDQQWSLAVGSISVGNATLVVSKDVHE